MSKNNFKKIFVLSLFCAVFFILPNVVWGADWYVRPSGGSYGTEYGTSYNNAWDGFSNIVWSGSGVVAGDTLKVCGTHDNEMLTTGLDGVSDNHITLDFSCDGNLGTITGLKTVAGWTLTSGDIYQYPEVTTARFVKYKGVFLTENDGAGSGVSLNEWDQDSGVIYINTGENPSLGDVQYTTMNTLLSVINNYIDIVGGVFSYARNIGIRIRSDNVSVDNVSVSYCYNWGIKAEDATSFTNPHTGITVENSSILDSGNTMSIEFSNISNGIIQRNIIEMNDLLDISAANFNGGIALYRGSDNNVVRFNRIRVSGDGISIRQKEVSADKSTYNQVYNNIIGPESSDILVLESSDYNNIFNNISYVSRDSAMYPALKMGDDFGVGTYSDNNDIKNNIFFQRYKAVDAKRVVIGNGADGPGVGNNNVIDNNIYYMNNLPDVLNGIVVNWYELGDPSSGHYTWGQWLSYGSNKYNQNSDYSDPLFSSSTPTLASGFTLQQTSPAIDSGTSVGLSSDYAGNSIYGVPDIGAYEYQPPYTIGTTDIPTTGDVRIYTDGKYRMKTASSTSATTSFSITPAGGSYQSTTTQYMDLTIDTWDTTGDQNKQWTATSTTGTFLTHATSTIYTVGDLQTNTYYNFNLDGTASTTSIAGDNCTNGVCLSDNNGQIIFTYIGGYSTHIFALNKDTSGPSSFNLATTDNTKTSNIQPTLTWEATTDSSAGLAKYQLYINGSLDTDNISTSATSVTPTTALTCGTHTWYIKAVDNNGNSTNSVTRNISMVCDSGVFQGTLSTPTTLTPRLQTILPDGTVIYLDEDSSVPSVSASDSATVQSQTTQTSTSVTNEIKKEFVYSFTKPQYIGAKGTGVTKLQQILRELGFFTYPTNTGYYGTVTETAVKQFQCDNNIVCTGTPDTTGYGVVGPKTREVLNKANSLQPTADSKEEVSTKTSTPLETTVVSDDLSLTGQAQEQQVVQLQQQIGDLLKMVEELQKQLLSV